MSDRRPVVVGKCRRLAVCLLTFLEMLSIARIGLAHEGHPAIPTTGAAVHGNELLLSEGARQAIGLTTAKVTLADMPTYVSANGTIIVPWRQQCYVTTFMSGVVDDVFVRPGDEVEKGHVLARISSLPLEQIQLDLLRAHADYLHFSEMHERRKTLSRSGAGFDAEFLEATYKREEAATRWQLAATKLQALGFDDDTLQRVCASAKPVGRIEIRSPMHGVVVDASIRGGQTVDRASQLFHIVDNSVVWCVADVPETDSGSVRVGQPAKVTVSSLADAPRQGRVHHIHLVVEPMQKVVPVVIELTNDDLKLRPGLSTRIEVQVGESEQAIVCPRESILNVGEDRYVLVQRGPGKFIRRQVQLGRLGTTRVEILDGVFPGDQVASDGAHLLGSLFQHPTDAATEPTTAGATEPTTAGATEPPTGLSRPVPPIAHATPPSLAATGVVELPTANKVFATSRVSGRITRIFVEHCQPVKKGDALAEIESVELFDVQLELVERYLQQRWTERHLAQLQKLSSARTIPQMSIQQLQNDLRKLKHEVATLTRRLIGYGLEAEQVSRLLAADATETDIAKLVSPTITIRAPHDGRVTHFDLSPGRIVDANDHELFEIHDQTQFWIKAYLLGQQARSVACGQRADVTFAADSTLRASGRIVRIAPTSAAAQGVFPVWMELDETPGTLREGMLARLQIHPVPTPTAVVPRVAAAPNQKGD